MRLSTERCSGTRSSTSLRQSALAKPTADGTAPHHAGGFPLGDWAQPAVWFVVVIRLAQFQGLAAEFSLCLPCESFCLRRARFNRCFPSLPQSRNGRSPRQPVLFVKQRPHTRLGLGRPQLRIDGPLRFHRHRGQWSALRGLQWRAHNAWVNRPLVQQDPVRIEHTMPPCVCLAARRASKSKRTDVNPHSVKGHRGFGKLQFTHQILSPCAESDGTSGQFFLASRRSVVVHPFSTGLQRQGASWPLSAMTFPT